MLETIYYSALAVAFAWALVDWRKGLYLCLIFDLARDPVRKLTEDHLVYITVTAALLWLGVFAGASRALGGQIFAALRVLPPLRNATNLLAVALLPAATVSFLLYDGGWKIMVIGTASYTLPIMGTVVGFHLYRKSDDVWRLLSFYCILNAVMLIGSILEFLKVDIPGLGGINMVWIRYEAGYIVELISGFYRSPDVMGLHAANTTMFSALLSIQPRTRYKWLWIAMVLWGTTCLILSGRRKMIGMLLVFAAIYLSLRIRRTGFARILPFTILVSSVIATVLLVMREGKDTQEYADYAQTTITQGGERLQENLVEGVLVSLRQTGVLGIGLGTATQGRYYVEGLAGTKAWQEDGISRIFAEMGLLGAIFMTLAIVNFIRAAYLAWKMVPIYSPIHEIQIGMLAIVGASVASFIVSHQAFSGDPCALLFVSLLFGVLLSGPIQVVRAMMAADQQAANVAGQLPRPRVGA